jgi:hypothetical protein
MVIISEKCRCPTLHQVRRVPCWEYAAYGSNINLEQMAFHCPAAQIIGKGWLMDCQLMFLGIPRGRGGVATVEPHYSKIIQSVRTTIKWHGRGFTSLKCLLT